MRTPNWSRFNAVIVTRHSDVTLYGKCAAFLAHIPYPRIVIKNPRPDEYMDRILGLTERKDFESYDWIINVDDDAFLWNPARLWALMAHMERTGHHYCGMSDGLTLTPREWGNPASMNPFFNVFHMSAIREQVGESSLIDALQTKIPWTSLECNLRWCGSRVLDDDARVRDMSKEGRAFAVERDAAVARDDDRIEAAPIGRTHSAIRRLQDRAFPGLKCR